MLTVCPMDPRGFLYLKESFTLAVSTSSESPLCLREWLNQLGLQNWMTLWPPFLVSGMD